MTPRPSKEPGKRKSTPRGNPRPSGHQARDLGLDSDEMVPFQESVKDLESQDEMVLGSKDTVGLPPPGREMMGIFRLHPRGFGFLVPDSPTDHGDLFVPAGRTGTALTGDHVRARVIHQPRRAAAGRGRSPYTGVVVEIIQRANKQYTGNLCQRGGQWLVVVDGKILHDPVIIRDPHTKHAKNGNKVVIELIEYPTDNEPAEGVITEVLGKTGQPDVETMAVMRSYGLAERFSSQVLDEARGAAGRFDDTMIPVNRQDLTGQLICTIDPPDAKDFDDAISIDRLDSDQQPDGAMYELGVHIADVSHFVVQGGVLDKEAYARGNSVYLPRKVIPMLPELLSNGVCSLQEGVNRFSKTIFIRYNAQGQVTDQRLVNTVIRSSKRLTYREAQALIDGDLGEARRQTRGQPTYRPELISALKRLDELARLLRRRRLADGMVVLDLPEVELVFDDQGSVTDAVPEDQAFTHTIIEMFMVEANEAVARLFDRLNVPILRRVHGDPDANHLRDLRQFAQVAGYNIPLRPTRTELQGLLDAVRGKPAQHAVHMAVLKTLAKAEYAPLPIGHFALASPHYAHFTSPIRRYPDLTVHRVVDAYLQQLDEKETYRRRHKRQAQIGDRLRDDQRCPDQQQLIEIGRHCSTMERNAESAERDLRTFLVLALLDEHVGDDFDGTVTGVTRGGIFVQLDRYLVDGFVAVTDLPVASGRGDHWKLNQTTGALVAQRSGKTITIGDRFVVRIANVKPAKRVMELCIVKDHPSTWSKRRQPQGARQAFKKTMKLKQVKKNDRKRNR